MTSRDSAVDAVSAEVERYWRLFCANTGTDVESRYIARIFGDPEIGVDIIDALVSAVKGGRKRGTTPCKVNLDHNNRSVPEVGDYWIVLDSRGLPACVVRVTKVEHARFDEVDEEWAATRGRSRQQLGVLVRHAPLVVSEVLSKMGRTLGGGCANRQDLL